VVSHQGELYILELDDSLVQFCRPEFRQLKYMHAIKPIIPTKHTDASIERAYHNSVRISENSTNAAMYQPM
jgi:hypothetical protein